MTFRHWLALCVVFCGLVLRAEQSPSAQAGWAEVDITPPMGLAMGGRGPTDTVGKSVIDPLYAQVLCLKDTKGTMFVLVSADLVGLGHELSERLRLAIVGETGADWNLVVLNVSHTHAGPQMTHTLFAGVGPLPQNEKDYYDSLFVKVISATRSACKSMTPVKAEVFEGSSQVAINRRGRGKGGQMAMIPNPEGPIAEKVWVMRLTPQNGAAPAVIFSYACHPVIVYSYAPSAISADFPGVARNSLRQTEGNAKAHFQFVQGLAGDVRPRVVADLEKNRFRTGKPEDVQIAGKQLAQDVLAAMKKPGKELRLDMAGTSDRASLLRDKPPARAAYAKMLENARGKGIEKAAQYWLERCDAGEGFAKADPWPVGLIRLAENQWVCYTAGEPVVEWGPLVTQWLAPRPVVMWGYCQESITYLPTDALLPQGGYEVLECNRARANSPAPFAPGLDESLKKSLLRQTRFLAAP